LAEVCPLIDRSERIVISAELIPLLKSRGRT